MLEVTGTTYTVIFLDYGNHQPATPADWLFTAAQMESLTNGDGGGAPAPSLVMSSEHIAAPHLTIQEGTKISTAADQLDAVDRLIETTAAAAPVPMPNGVSKTSRMKASSLPSSLDEFVPPPPPPPPMPPAKDKREKRLELAAQLLGVAPPSAHANAALEAAAKGTNGSSSNSNVAVDAGPFFGIELSDLYVRDGTAVPKVLVAAAEELKKRAHVEGIFRIPGRAHTVSSLVDKADKGLPLDLDKQDTPEIASFLKKFYALLPSSVIPSELVDRFGQKRLDARSLCVELRQIVDQVLPPERGEVLSFTLELLNAISRKSEQNKMTSVNLATVFLPALFFSVQGDSTSPEEIMKMAVLGKAVSATLAFMIENPTLDPALAENMTSVPGAGGAATIPVHGSPQVQRAKSAGSSNAASPVPVRRNSFSKGHLKGTGSRRRSSTLPDLQQSDSVGALNAARAAGGSPKLSAESVLAAMRKEKDRLERRAGSFSPDGNAVLGRRGVLLLAKKKLWFLIVNDWLYWFADEVRDVSSNPSALARALGNYAGNICMSRCNVVAGKKCELIIVQPSGPNLHLVAESQQLCDDWMFNLWEISIVGFPVPTFQKEKEDWLTIRNQEMLAKIDGDTLLFYKDKEKGKVAVTVDLVTATVAKGKTTSGRPGFVIADRNDKWVVETHNPGVAQEWVDLIKSAIIFAWTRKYEPETLAMKKM